MRRRDGPAGRLYKFAGLREHPILVAASPLQDYSSAPRQIGTWRLALLIARPECH